MWSSSCPDERSIGLPVVVGSTIVATAIGAVLGWWIGVASSPLIGVETDECATASPTEPGPTSGTVAFGDPEAADALEQALLTNLQLAAKLESLERLAEEAHDQGLTPAEAAAVVISGLRDSDLSVLAGMLTGMGADELAEVDDLRGFTRRLAAVAIEGELEGARGGEPAAGGFVAPIFATEVEIRNPHVVASTTFQPDTSRIVAMIHTRDFEDRSLMVRWSRTDQPEVLGLQSLAVTANSDWTATAHQRSGGFASGSYLVSVYSRDAAMDPVASGSFVVVARSDE